jgi:N-acetylglutamate synthase-like GNAT family acetyltransferase
LIAIRPTEDLNAVRRLGVECGLEPDADGEATIVLAWAAFDDDRLVGCVALETFAGLDVVSWLAVAGEYRGRGVGRQLLRAAENGAGDLGIRELWATARAPGFFVRHGYSVSGGGGERELLLPACEKCPQYEVDCHPKIVKKALVATLES